MFCKILFTLLLSWLTTATLEYELNSQTSIAVHSNRFKEQSNAPIPYRNVTKTPISTNSPMGAIPSAPAAQTTPSKPSDIPQSPILAPAPLVPQSFPSTSSKPNVKPALTLLPVTVAPVPPPLFPTNMPGPKPVPDLPSVSPTVVHPTKERPAVLPPSNPAAHTNAPQTSQPVTPPYDHPTTKNPALAPIPSPIQTKQPITSNPIVSPVLQPHTITKQPADSFPSSPFHSKPPISKPFPIPVVTPTTQQPIVAPSHTTTAPTAGSNGGSKDQGSPVVKAFTYMFLISLLAYGAYLGYVNRGTILFILGRMAIECAFRIRRFISQIRNRVRRMGRRTAEPSLNELLFEDSTQAELSTRLLPTDNESSE